MGQVIGPVVPGWTPAPQPFPAECRKLGDGPDELVAGQWVQSPTVASLICPPSALTRDVTQDRSCPGRVRTGRQVAALGLAGHGTGARTLPGRVSRLQREGFTSLSRSRSSSWSWEKTKVVLPGREWSLLTASFSHVIMEETFPLL